MTTQLKIHPNVRGTPGDDDGSVLINLKTGKVFSLNGLGAKVWARLEEGFTFEAVLDSLMLEYDLPRQRLLSDLETFVGELEKKELVQRCQLPG